ncbi:hypothetical protein BS50DRAFT_573693 [Corynespora cassiicola Philippines]|uniref:Uncharacterized protein n=1 Tax=Corynespora cassiicola Philippines TaxID=1448308 RepID=A0A2T2NNA5_CORCC|nr:hypothetical protein BS50DRAFT_573693 [Corynespora cassiicola Philippines]
MAKPCDRHPTINQPANQPTNPIVPSVRKRPLPGAYVLAKRSSNPVGTLLEIHPRRADLSIQLFPCLGFGLGFRAAGAGHWAAGTTGRRLCPSLPTSLRPSTTDSCTGGVRCQYAGKLAESTKGCTWMLEPPKGITRGPWLLPASELDPIRLDEYHAIDEKKRVVILTEARGNIE